MPRQHQYTSMRVVNVKTLELEVIEHGDYAILSHTWGADADEVTYQEMMDPTKRATIQHKPGYQKIVEVCRVLRETVDTRYAAKYIWIDTCCIDKTSSAELSEAINSMFAYYRDARACLLYLADLVPEPSREKDTALVEHMRWCRAFSRGWCLQELIAPKRLTVYDGAWKAVGTKHDPFLVDAISSICGIHANVLTHRMPVHNVPVAVRMSWAASRQTKRPEDQAYSLLGIFDVAMPLLYGEGGTKAFIRLQEEIIKDNADMSIFAWRGSDTVYDGIFATEPSLFRTAGQILAVFDPLMQAPDFRSTNKGIQFSTPLQYEPVTGGHILPLYHGDHLDGSSVRLVIGVLLRQIGPTRYVRAVSDRLFAYDKEQGIYTQDFHVVKTVAARASMKMIHHALHVAFDTDVEIKAHPPGCFDRANRCLVPDPSGLFFGVLEFQPTWAEEYDSFLLVCRSTGFFSDAWDFALLSGDQWLRYDRDQQVLGGQLARLSLGNAKKGTSLVLKHLYMETHAKELQASLMPDETKMQTMVELRVMDMPKEQVLQLQSRTFP